ncbi:MAG: ABC transporter permease [Gammaproteobacteria bacterium]|nr:ABC transporter permease [Gammaproteobacteria bacterium]MDE2139717.1 ABC transporter permease [Gammaproteobacteria bacterium]
MAVRHGLTFSENSAAGARRLLTINKVVPAAPMPVAYAERIAQVPGVKAVTYYGAMVGAFQKFSNAFAVVSAPAQSLFQVFPELYVPAAERQSWLQDRTGALVTPKLMQQFGWKVGEKVPILTRLKQKDGSTTWYMTIDGVITNRAQNSSGAQQMFIHYKYFDETRAAGEGTVNQFDELLDTPSQAGPVSQAIDTLFTNASPQTRTGPEQAVARSIFAQVGSIGAIITDVAIAVFFSMLLIIGAILLHSARERLSEFALLKALGFGSRTVTGVVLGESLLTCLVGGVTGMIFAYLLIAALRQTVTQVLPSFEVTSLAIALSLALMVLFGVLASLLPMVQLSRLSVRDALGRA